MHLGSGSGEDLRLLLCGVVGEEAHGESPLVGDEDIGDGAVEEELHLEFLSGRRAFGQRDAVDPIVDASIIDGAVEFGEVERYGARSSIVRERRIAVA